ncbi:hypothetical protein ACA910_010346 [Epithemia clementina (nom. ined.)]
MCGLLRITAIAAGPVQDRKQSADEVQHPEATDETCDDSDDSCRSGSTDGVKSESASGVEGFPLLFTRLGSFELLETVPHDTNSFTQGLELWNETHILESAGLYGESNVRLVEIQTGKVVQETKLEDAYFAEGLTRCNKQKTNNNNPNDDNEGDDGDDELILLTWKEQLAFRIDPISLKLQSNVTFTTTNNQGWGVACDLSSNRLYVTDGTSFLHVWNAQTMQEISKVQVTFQWPPDFYQSEQQVQAKPIPVDRLNELELDSDPNDAPFTILANIWYQDLLVRIDPENGFVTTVYDLSTLRPMESREETEDCLNGIAKVSQNVFWVTGKLWPVMYKIRLIDFPEDEWTMEE